jgi:peptidylprolyl isomerase
VKRLIVLLFALTALGCPSPGASGGSQTAGANVMVAADEQLTTTPSGLRYRDLALGEGPAPEAGRDVVVHYTGWLLDGTKFDSSVDRNAAFKFKLGAGAVIAGWDEGVATMQVGGKRKLVIPPALGYGDRQVGPIPAGSTLVFEVELLEIR